MATVFKEVWLGELLQDLNDLEKQQKWFGAIRDYGEFIGNEVVHLGGLAAEPGVIVGASLRDQVSAADGKALTAAHLENYDLTVSCLPYRTEPIWVSDEELYALTYDKKSAVTQAAARSLARAKFTNTLFNIAPAANTAKTPVLTTTGANSGDGSRKMLTFQDIIRLKIQLDKLGYPADGRVLVLCPDHEQDLLMSSQVFNNMLVAFQDHNGEMPDLYGFKIATSNYAPLYGKVSGNGSGNAYERKAAGTANAAQASVMFLTHRVWKATGELTMYYDDAANNPLTQSSTVAFKQIYNAGAFRAEGTAAIASAAAA